MAAGSSSYRSTTGRRRPSTSRSATRCTVSRPHPRRRTVAAISRWLLSLAVALATATIARAAEPDRIMPLEVTVNGAKSGTWLLLERGGRLYAPRDAFEEWRLQIPADAERVDFKGQPYAPLGSVPGFKSKVDFASQSVELLFSPQAFAASRLTREVVKVPVASPVLPSVFLNYDVSYSHSAFRDASGIDDLGVLTALVAPTSW